MRVRHLTIGVLIGVPLLLTALSERAEAAWVLWTREPPGLYSWNLHSAYTFRATCLVVAFFWDYSNFDEVRPDGSTRRRSTRGAGGQSWCLPAGVRPE